MSTKLDSKAVHEIRKALPGTGDTVKVGYRCVLPSEPMVIRELQADGTFSRIDIAEGGLGSMMIVVGHRESDFNMALYLKAETVHECLTPFFGGENEMVPTKIAFWGDRISCPRNSRADADFLLIKENGDSNRIFKRVGVTCSDIYIDSLFNLYIATQFELAKYSYSEPDSIITSYLVDDGSIPFDKIKFITGKDRELFVVQNETDVFMIAYFSGYQWTDLTAQFLSDMGLTSEDFTAAVCTCITMDDSGNLLIAMTGSDFSNKLFVYDGITFSNKMVATGVTVINKMVKIGNLMYTITNENILKVWKYDTLEVLFSDLDHLLGIVTDGEEVIVWTVNQINKCVAGGYDFSKDDVVINDLDGITSYAITIVDIAAVPGKRVYLLDGDHPIVKGDFEEQWVSG